MEKPKTNIKLKGWGAYQQWYFNYKNRDKVIKVNIKLTMLFEDEKQLDLNIKQKSTSHN